MESWDNRLGRVTVDGRSVAASKALCYTGFQCLSVAQADGVSRFWTIPIRNLACGAKPGNRMPRSTHHRHYRAFLQLLVQLRDEARLTQAALAERIGNTQTFVSKVERGERRLDVVEFAEWCDALELDAASAFAQFAASRDGKSRKLRRRRQG